MTRLNHAWTLMYLRFLLYTHMYIATANQKSRWDTRYTRSTTWTPSTCMLMKCHPGDATCRANARLARALVVHLMVLTQSCIGRRSSSNDQGLHINHINLAGPRLRCYLPLLAREESRSHDSCHYSGIIMLSSDLISEQISDDWWSFTSIEPLPYCSWAAGEVPAVGNQYEKKTERESPSRWHAPSPSIEVKCKCLLLLTSSIAHLYTSCTFEDNHTRRQAGTPPKRSSLGQLIIRWGLDKTAHLSTVFYNVGEIDARTLHVLCCITPAIAAGNFGELPMGTREIEMLIRNHRCGRF